MIRRNNEWKLQLSRARTLSKELNERRERLLNQLNMHPNHADFKHELKAVELELRIINNEVEELTERLVETQF